MYGEISVFNIYLLISFTHLIIHLYSGKMTILPQSKPKKVFRKDEKSDWSHQTNQSQGGSSTSSRMVSSSSSSSSSIPLSHPSHPTHPTHSRSSQSPGPPRKIPRCKPLLTSSSSSSSNTSSTIPISSSSIPPPSLPQSTIGSPRGDNKQQQGGGGIPCITIGGNGDKEGANSDDEYDRGFRDEEMEDKFENRLRNERGLHIMKMVGDGACLFRAVAHQIYGDEEMHGEVRRLCLDYMEKNREHFEEFITEDFNAYIARKRRPTVHGNHVELQAISEIFNRPIEIYEYNIEPINVFHPKPPSSIQSMAGPSSSTAGSSSSTEREPDLNPPIRMSYHGSTHYNAVMDPLVPSIGIGLGLPGLEGGLADRELLAEAIAKSERQQIEEVMLQDKMSMSDWQRTEEDLKDQVARESYLEYVRSLEKNKPSTSSSMNLPSSSSSHIDYDMPCSSKRSGSSPSCSMNSSQSLPLPSSLSTLPPSTSSTIHPPLPPSSSLYEELLMAEALEWNDDQNECVQESTLAEALLLSQESFIAECSTRRDERKSPKGDDPSI